MDNDLKSGFSMATQTKLKDDIKRACQQFFRSVTLFISRGNLPSVQSIRLQNRENVCCVFIREPVPIVIYRRDRAVLNHGHGQKSKA